mgnify:CR=1 FL=1
MHNNEYPKNHGQRWTTRDQWKLVKLYAQTNPILTWRSIAEDLGRTVPACQFRMFIIRLAFSLNQELDPNKLMKALASGSAINHKK